MQNKRKSTTTERRKTYQHGMRQKRFLQNLTSLPPLLLLFLLISDNAAAARRSRVQNGTAKPVAGITSALAANYNLDRAANEELIPVNVQQPPSLSTGATAAAAPMPVRITDKTKNNITSKHDQSSKTAVDDAATAGGDSKPKPANAELVATLGLAFEKSAAHTNIAKTSSMQLLKEQKQRPAGEYIDFEGSLPVSTVTGGVSNIEECDPDMVGFEIVTGFVFSAPDRLLDSLPGTLMLTDCLEACQSNETCHAINYETGLCVLFSSNADRLPGALTKSQFPVFTIYAQKSCLGVRPCARAWCVDRVQNYRLNGQAKRALPVTSRRDCLELCLGETEFTCRSANYYRTTNTCELFEMDRITLAGTSAFQAHDSIDYLENNCAEEPNKLCEFKRLSGRILKTVDSVYQDVGSIDECRDLCLNSPYRCHSYDFGDTGDMVCRLSHHSRATLSDVQDPYLEVPEAATYELSSCYNVTIECGAGDMVARIRTSKLFDGKVYAKGSPKSCSIDVKNSLDFELRMGYQDLECNVRQSGGGRYINDVVIQHHDTIVTSSDLGLAVTCQYDLTNKTVTNDVDLGVKGDIEAALSEEVIVDSPNVLMKITSRDGSDIMRSAEVGDPLALKFEIMDEQSPYEIFVRELVAMDGADNAEITLIDSHGCPTDHFIMGPVYKSSLSGKILLSQFDAFKFPSSEVVQFRALVTPCMPNCEPVQCDQEDVSGEFKSLMSYGRRRKRSLNATATMVEKQKNQQQLTSIRTRRETNDNPSQEDMLLVQSIQITDKFGFEKQQHQQQSKSAVYDNNETVYLGSEATQGLCVNSIGLIVAATIFLLVQLGIIAIWTYLYQRQRKQQPFINDIVRPSTTYSGHNSNSGSGNGNGSSISTNVLDVSKARTEQFESCFAGRHHVRQF